MKKTTLYFSALFCLFVTSKVSAQYFVSTSTGTYTDLVNPTVLVSGTTFKSNYMANIPGAVTFFNKSYGTDHASTQGQETNVFPTFAMLVTEANSGNSNAEVSVFGNCGVQGLDATSSLSYLVTGDTKTGIIKFQWKNIGLKGSGAATDFINIQLWLNRADKSVTVVMGPHQITGSTAFGTHGNTCIGIDEYDGGFNSILASAYLKGDPAAPTVVTGARALPLSLLP
jgi:hypothetical protein